MIGHGPPNCKCFGQFVRGNRANNFSVFNSTNIPTTIQRTFLACPIPHTNKPIPENTSQFHCRRNARRLVPITCFSLSTTLSYTDKYFYAFATAGAARMTIVITRRSVLGLLQRFGGKYCLHLQDVILFRTSPNLSSPFRICDFTKFHQTFLHNRHICFLPICSASTWTKLNHPEEGGSTFFSETS